MEIDVKKVGSATVAALSGELDSNTAPEAQKQIESMTAADSRLIIDLSRVSFISSAGLRVLLFVYRKVVAGGGRVLLVGISPEIKDTMQVTGFLSFFQHADTLEEGLRQVAAEPS
jgi:anti-sigma B factor antagonist